MKVLQILPSLEVGGVERGVIDLARAMKNRGEETVVISSGGQLVSELHKMGIMHYALPVHQKSLWSLTLVPKIIGIIERERIDVIHARSRVPAWLAWLASRKTNVPMVTTCHGYYSTHFLSRIMGWGKRVIVISRIVGRHMIDDFGVACDRIRLVHRGIDLSQFPFDQEKYDRPSEKLRIINVGRLTPIKGQVEFLRAVHLLRRELQHIEVWLVGAEGKGKHKYTEKLEQTIQQLGLENCVKLLGTRRDIPDLLRQSDLLVLSTLVPEAFGRVVVEAGATGTAVISTRVGGVLDIIDDGENGLLVPPGDIQAMAEAMHEILKDRKRSKLLAGNLRKKTEEHFRLDQMLDKTLDVYHEVRSEKRIAVLKLGAMGDLILIIPSLRMIRNRHPSAYISVIVDKKWASLVSACPYINDVIPIDRHRLSNCFYLLKVAKKIREEAFDISVDLQNSKWTHALSFLAGIPNRIAYSRGPFKYLINRPQKPVESAESPVKNQFRLLSKLGATELDERLELWADPKSKQSMDDLFEKAGLCSADNMVGFVVGSSVKWPTKRWPIDNFYRLAERIIRDLKCKVVLIGSKHDAAEAASFSERPLEGVTNWVGETAPEDLVSLIQRLDVLVTGDTAPLHVAGAAKTRIVGLFGPTDPRRHMPPAEDAIVLMKHLTCQPCYKGVCLNEDKLACLTNITVDEVFQAVQKQLALAKESPKQEVKV